MVTGVELGAVKIGMHLAALCAIEPSFLCRPARSRVNIALNCPDIGKQTNATATTTTTTTTTTTNDDDDNRVVIKFHPFY
jgi:hypothetical protein